MRAEWYRIKKKRFLNKIRYGNERSKSRATRGGLLILVCENCRIKDGLGRTRLQFGVCSYCGRQTRCYYYNPYGGDTVGRPMGRSYYLWVRGPTIWKDHGRKKR